MLIPDFVAQEPQPTDRVNFTRLEAKEIFRASIQIASAITISLQNPQTAKEFAFKAHQEGLTVEQLITKKSNEQVQMIAASLNLYTR